MSDSSPLTGYAMDDAKGYVQHHSVEYSPIPDAPKTPMTYLGNLPSRPSRLVKRSNGRSVVKYKDLPSLSWRYCKDWFTTIMNSPWYIIIILFFASYCVSWTLFGLGWWAIDEIYIAARNRSCVNNIDSFPSAFLFSLETQITIGYGFRIIRPDCAIGILFLIIQCVCGLLLDSFTIGLIFAKLTRPRNRRKTLLFSNRAVLYEENGNRYLSFRVADIRRSQLVEAHVRVQLYWYKKDGHKQHRLEVHDLDVGYDTGGDRMFLLTPWCVTHKITPNSPLYGLDKNNLLEQDIEVVAILEAIVESTGLTAQALWSYTEQEIQVDHKFQAMVFRNATTREWEVNFNRISYTEPVECD